MVRTNTDERTHDIFSSVAVQPNGTIVAAGETDVRNNGTFSANFAVLRYNASGRLDSGFGRGGMVLTDFGLDPKSPNDDRASAMALQRDGSVVVAGSSAPGTGTSRLRFAVARYMVR